jgi:hypothetical protein
VAGQDLVAGSSEYGNELSGSIKRTYIYHPNEYQFLRGCALCSQSASESTATLLLAVPFLKSESLPTIQHRNLTSATKISEG